ncbi:RNA polymerase subunit sigma [Streptomyces sp. NPDC090106]|uniref:RNA polymerase subunit sigma n=1 Tax=Streptomyces sp. NPDC090106 TaxID=3365946 RepID=UPI0038288796
MGTASVGDIVPLVELLDERRHLVEIAHRTLGSRGMAERVTDEAYREWYGLPESGRSGIATPRTWLSDVVGGLALARLAPPAPPIPPAPSAPSVPPAPPALLAPSGPPAPPSLESGVPAVRSVPERVDPAGTAALHGLRARRARPASPRRQEEAACAVRQACADGDHERLVPLLAHDVRAFFDGGGKLRTPLGPVTGAAHVAASLLTLLPAHPRTTVDTHPVNGRTGLVARCHGRVAAVITLDLADALVAQIWIVVNPDKLRSWNSPRLNRA